jgi:hypothetical protein
MRLKAQATFESALDAINFSGRNSTGLACAGYKLKYPRSSQDIQPTLKSASEEYVAGEERQRKNFGAILPTTNRFIKRQQDLEAFVGKNVTYILLVLMTRVQRVPYRSWTRYFVFDGTAPPCDLHRFCCPKDYLPSSG